MNTTEQSLEAIRDIKRIMERSSRFISLSGWSGVAAGICALAGAWVAHERIMSFRAQHPESYRNARGSAFHDSVKALNTELLIIAGLVFLAAFLSAFLFTYLRSKKAGVPVWGVSAQRLMWNTTMPLLAGGIVILRLLYDGYYELLAPCCLVFYGLALVNGSKYTLGEVKYLGYGQVLLGIINLWLPGYSLLFWAAGFGLLHIIYGVLMWSKYERVPV